MIEAESLAKRFTLPGGKVVDAVEDVSFRAEPGTIHGLLGPNGAGKTTLIGAVCGLVRPSGGTIHAFGHDLARD